MYLPIYVNCVIIYIDVWFHQYFILKEDYIMTNINAILPKGYQCISDGSLIVCRDLQKKFICQLKELNPDFYEEAILAALAKTAVDAKGFHCCLIDICEVKPGKLGQTITKEDFVIKDSMELKLKANVQPMFLDNHMTLNVVVVEIST